MTGTLRQGTLCVFNKYSSTESPASAHVSHIHFFQLSQRARKMEHDLEVHWSLEAQRRIDCEVQRMRDQMLHECENDIKLIGKYAANNLLPPPPLKSTNSVLEVIFGCKELF